LSEPASGPGDPGVSVIQTEKISSPKTAIIIEPDNLSNPSHLVGKMKDLGRFLEKRKGLRGGEVGNFLGWTKPT